MSRAHVEAACQAEAAPEPRNAPSTPAGPRAEAATRRAHARGARRHPEQAEPVASAASRRSERKTLAWRCGAGARRVDARDRPPRPAPERGPRALLRFLHRSQHAATRWCWSITGKGGARRGRRPLRGARRAAPRRCRTGCGLPDLRALVSASRRPRPTMAARARSMSGCAAPRAGRAVTPFGQRVRRTAARARAAPEGHGGASRRLRRLPVGARARRARQADLGLVQGVLQYFHIIWDEADELAAPRRPVGPAASRSTPPGRDPRHRAVPNRLARELPALTDDGRRRNGGGARQSGRARQILAKPGRPPPLDPRSDAVRKRGSLLRSRTSHAQRLDRRSRRSATPSSTSSPEPTRTFLVAQERAQGRDAAHRRGARPSTSTARWGRRRSSPAARGRTRPSASPPSAAKAAFIGKVKDDEIGRHFAPRSPRDRRPLRRAAATRRAGDGPQLHPGDAGRRAHHEHLSRRLPEPHARRTSTAHRRAASRTSISKAICGIRRRPSEAFRKAVTIAHEAGNAASR